MRDLLFGFFFAIIIYLKTSKKKSSYCMRDEGVKEPIEKRYLHKYTITPFSDEESRNHGFYAQSLIPRVFDAHHGLIAPCFSRGF